MTDVLGEAPADDAATAGATTPARAISRSIRPPVTTSYERTIPSAPTRYDVG
jgi:hypothetical protein